MKILSKNKPIDNIIRLILLNLSLLCLVFFSHPIFAKEQRIVSIGGDLTEIIYALGADDKLVARDSTSISPEQVLKLPDVGYMRMLNAEGILAQKPDLIIASEDAGPASVFTQLNAVNANVLRVTSEKSVESTREKIIALGNALDLKDKASILIGQFDEELSQVTTSPLGVKAVFILTFEGAEASVAGTQTAPDAMFNYIGIKNAAQSMTRYQKFSAEGMAAMNPDVIVVSKRGIDKLGEDKIWELPGVNATLAGKHKKLIVVDDIGFLGFTLQTPNTLKDFRLALEAL
ncbi:heme/hemin ABC transporter substrate-binding protein [Thorsellia anophelis]|uniref:Iron complex transport system substrate-binding protein n=1 Tax=Thorsellia anophelis DSM 18579 TaxID=1123402 RepID=A0A1I0EE44_9GAMM|nr:ABC transporter substrate-binding protein [Thorsellia anophelis]SET43325.1 iron complex transport system substrate-binding protein [Thorsellia anophelis DSM 18579]